MLKQAVLSMVQTLSQRVHKELIQARQMPKSYAVNNCLNLMAMHTAPLHSHSIIEPTEQPTHKKLQKIQYNKYFQCHIVARLAHIP